MTVAQIVPSGADDGNGSAASCTLRRVTTRERLIAFARRLNPTVRWRPGCSKQAGLLRSQKSTKIIGGRLVRTARPPDNVGCKVGSKDEGFEKTDFVTSETTDKKDLQSNGGVLRFYGYFQEAVHMSALENCRVRKVVVHYFLADDSVAILEPREANSGLVQGNFLRRQKATDGNGKSVLLGDLELGRTVTIFGRGIRLVDCDRFTEKYFHDHAMLLGNKESYPESQLAVAAQNRAKFIDANRKITTSDAGGGVGNTLLESLGLNSGGKKIARATELRFFTFLEDRFGLRTYCVIVYYPSDLSLEVRDHSGKRLYRRSQVEKRANQAGITLLGLSPTPDLLVRPDDILTGGIVRLYGQDFHVYDCDERTRTWYAANLPHLQPQEPHLEVFPNEDPHYKEERGSSSDRLQRPTGAGVISLSGSRGAGGGPGHYSKSVAKSRRGARAAAYRGTVLRFSAKLADAAEVDTGRSFIVSLYLADNTLAVYETKQENAGFIGGAFIQRMLLRNLEKERNFRPQDFYVGASVTLIGRGFVLTKADEFTLRFMETHHRTFPFASLVHSRNIARVLEKARQDEFASPQALLTYCRAELNVCLTEHEALTLMRASRREDGVGIDLNTVRAYKTSPDYLKMKEDKHEQLLDAPEQEDFGEDE